MFANNNIGVMNLGFPDVCTTPPGVPIPYPNIELSPTHIPTVPNVIVGGGLAENLLTPGTVSLGDTSGVLLGVASGTVAGPDHPILGSFKTMFGTAFATRLTTLNLQNLTNTVGVSITPAQFIVLVLA